MSQSEISLMSLTTRYRWHLFSVGVLGLLLGVQGLISSLNQAHIESVEGAVQGILRSELSTANPWNLARAIEDLRYIDFLRCPIVEQLEPIRKLHLDLHDKGECHESVTFLTGRQVSLVTAGISGAKWKISFFVPTPITTQVSLWLSRGFTIALFTLVFLYIKSIFERQRHLNQVETAHLQAMHHLSTQVAHDIRSPLAAISALEKDLAILPEEKRVMLRSALNRIHDIANDLLQKNRELTTKSSTGNISPPLSQNKSITEPTQYVLLSSLIDPLVTEKRLQYRSQIGIHLDARVDAGSYGLFAHVEPTELKRVLSNLVNNAVEVLGGQGQVTLVLGVREQQIEILVKDTGKGIPPEVLSRLGRRGETHGKAGGSGLGLYHAKTAVESWGGKLAIESEVNKGTCIRIRLPQAHPPEWFVSSLNLKEGTSIVILDDDTSIHQIWQGRFDSLNVHERGIGVVHLSTPDQLRAWIKENQVNSMAAVYLADYELLGFKETGLSLIDDLNISSNSILVTSRFEESHIQEECRRLKVRLIPKGLAGFVPIQMSVPQRKPDAVLIDDDSLVHMSWKLAAKREGKVLEVYFKPEEFLALVDNLDFSTPIYVDSKLSNGIKGEDVSRQVSELGFTEVYLATGYSSEQFQPMPWLRKVTGKEPPWM